MTNSFSTDDLADALRYFMAGGGGDAEQGERMCKVMLAFIDQAPQDCTMAAIRAAFAEASDDRMECPL